MVSIAEQLRFPARPGRHALVWAFIERQTNLWKRYWAWELVWLVYGVVNTLAVTLIANQVGQSGGGQSVDVSRLVLFGIMHATVRTLIIFAIALPFFSVHLGQADWLAAVVVLLVGSFSVAGLAIFAGILPMLYPERGQQMSMMIQAFVLLVSGVYYEVAVLPDWLQWLAYISPATYILDGIRGAIIDGDSLIDIWRQLAALVVFGGVLIPGGLALFGVAERWAKKTGRLKRQG